MPGQSATPTEHGHIPAYKREALRRRLATHHGRGEAFGEIRATRFVSEVKKLAETRAALLDQLADMRAIHRRLAILDRSL